MAEALGRKEQDAFGGVGALPCIRVNRVVGEVIAAGVDGQRAAVGQHDGALHTVDRSKTIGMVGEQILPLLFRHCAPARDHIIAQSFHEPKGYFVADEKPEAFETYEATFPAKEKAFQEGQLPQFCQSCGMSLTKHEDCGTNADGSTNFVYCQYCYKDGQFLQECTMDEILPDFRTRRGRHVGWAVLLRRFSRRHS